MRQTVLLTLAIAGLTLAGCGTAPTAHPLPDVCHRKPDAGNGKATITRFYYDSNDQRCRSFIYGGAGGQVPFQTLGTCMATCYAPAPNLMPDNDARVSPRTSRVK